MSTRLLFFVVYLAYALAYGSLTKQGSGADPSGLHSLTPPSPPASDQGSGADPWG